MRAVREIDQADLWRTVAAAYAAAREFMASDAPEVLAGCAVRPVPVAGRYALQLESGRPARVVGYLSASDVPASEMRESREVPRN